MRTAEVLILGALLSAGCSATEHGTSRPPNVAGSRAAESGRPGAEQGRESDVAIDGVAPPAGTGRASADVETEESGGRREGSVPCPTPTARPSTVGPLTLGGVVVGPSGTPVANARVAVYSRAHAREGSSPCVAMEGEGATDRRGRFEVTTSPRDWPYYYLRWIEVSRGDLFGALRWESVESSRALRVTAHPTQRFEVEVRCERAGTFNVAGRSERLPEGPDLTVYRGTSRRGRSIPLPPREESAAQFGAELRLRPGRHELVFSGVCGVHTETVRVRRGTAGSSLSLTLPRPDAGAIEMSFDEPHISRVHLVAGSARIETVVHEHGATDPVRIDGVSPGDYRLVRHLNSTDPACVREVTVRPDETTRVSLRFPECRTPARDDVR